MDDPRIAAIEARVASALDAASFADAARAALEGYGPEILGFLLAVQRNETEAREVFAQFSEDLWRALPKFRREASMRTWSYKLARAALSHFARDPFRQRAVELCTDDYTNLVARISSQVAREHASAKLEAARAALDSGDQELLILRIDRKLAWDEIATIMELDPSVLRKRFERVKDRLRDAIAEL